MNAYRTCPPTRHFSDTGPLIPHLPAGLVGCRPPGTAALSRVLFSVPVFPVPLPPSVPEPEPPVPGTSAGTSSRHNASDGTHPSPDRAVTISDVQVFLPGTRARYSCDPGYVMVGEATRTCLKTGQWTGDVPRCCESPPPPPEVTSCCGGDVMMLGSDGIMICRCAALTAHRRLL